MSKEIQDYIGKTIDGVGYISGYNDNDDTFTVRITYCDHIKVKKSDLDLKNIIKNYGLAIKNIIKNYDLV